MTVPNEAESESDWPSLACQPVSDIYAEAVNRELCVRQALAGTNGFRRLVDE